MKHLLLCCLLAVPAAAQDFELDISDDEPTPDTNEDLKPSIAVISVRAADKDSTSGPRARQLLTEFLKQLGKGGRYGAVVEPASAKNQLGADYARIDECTDDYSCFEEAARKLNVHRVVRMTVEKRGAGSQVEVYGYDPGFAEILHVSQDSAEKAEKTFVGVAGKSQAAKDKEFMKKMYGFLQQVQKRLGTPNGRIAVDNADPGAFVTVNGSEGGVGSVDVIVQRGVHAVKVSASGFKPFEETVTVAPGQEVTVKVTLEALPLEMIDAGPVVEPPSKAPGVVGGLALIAVGAGAAVAGILLALDAQNIAAQMQGAAPGSQVPVTRAEAVSAPGKQMAANILIPAGAAAVAGGTTWLVVTLLPAPAATGTTKPLEPTESVGTGAMVQFGGRF